jgi:hypothetical protein
MVKIHFRNIPKNPPTTDFSSFCPKSLKRIPFNADFQAESNGTNGIQCLPLVHEILGVYLSETLQALKIH